MACVVSLGYHYDKKLSLLMQLVYKEAILSMKWFYNLTESFAVITGQKGGPIYRNKQIDKDNIISSILNMGCCFLLGVILTGCGQSLQGLSPVQPVDNISVALMGQAQNPEQEVELPTIPAEELAKPLFDKHGLQIVGFRFEKAQVANTNDLTYMLAFSEYTHDLDKWNKFLSEWSDVQDEIELPRPGENTKKADVILLSDYPEAFDIHAKQHIVTKTLDDITVSICYWRRADLDRKYNRGNAFSPFYEREAMNQGDKTDVFYVKITNNRSEYILVDVKKCYLFDQGKTVYKGLNFENMRDRFTDMTRVTGLYVKKGLETARQILLEKRMPIVEKQVGLHRTGVQPGESVEGFLPFVQLKPNTVKLQVILPIEKAPPPGGAQRYQTVEFIFPFTHDRGIRVAQPPPQRY